MPSLETVAAHCCAMSYQLTKARLNASTLAVGDERRMALPPACGVSCSTPRGGAGDPSQAGCAGEGSYTYMLKTTVQQVRGHVRAAQHQGAEQLACRRIGPSEQVHWQGLVAKCIWRGLLDAKGQSRRLFLRSMSLRKCAGLVAI